MKTIENATVHIGGRQHVSPQEVIVLIAEINYTIVHFSDGHKTIVATSLKYLEERFHNCNFFRTHRSYVVNLNYIEKLRQSSVLLSNGQEIEVSRRRKTDLQKAMNRF
ncbi:LytTR family DNA-binding domain-containing protein [Emticicia sp. BO119]|uniref:LytR/AlgR family response regulator transcription factor n=1 Tax=Emticicia sp. BO119 TaxID=2757768 RepID=UPI0015F07C76|nr:LytTR family DNA-binding domain-containing protein [Emticicia sp. BO119]MBA4850499.1 LytTR family transcriptional regulator DNA-binding domain-containing protein [Emticicia sp. BO119]